MSLGGDFYALTDVQLEQILVEQLDFFEFYQKDAAQGGAQTLFTEGEDAWDVLRVFFDPLPILGTHHTDLIPEAAFYSTAFEVRELAAELAQFSVEQLRERFEADDFQSGDYYHGEGWLAEPDEFLALVQALIQYYQQCAATGHALIYRMT